MDKNAASGGGDGLLPTGEALKQALGEVNSEIPLPPGAPRVPFFQPYSASLVDSDVNEIYVVDAPKRSLFHFAGFIEDIEGAWVFYGGGCEISLGYGTNANASTDLSKSGKSVDILFNNS